MSNLKALDAFDKIPDGPNCDNLLWQWNRFSNKSRCYFLDHSFNCQYCNKNIVRVLCDTFIESDGKVTKLKIPYYYFIKICGIKE